MNTHTLFAERTRPSLLGAVVATSGSSTALFLRLVLAASMLPHGLQKVFGLFGGTPLGESIAALSSAFGLPWVVSALVVAIEILGPIALALGLFSRIAAAGIAAVMIGAVATVHGAHGFMMNWAGSASGEGYEYHILVTAIASVVIALGSGRLSLDRMLQRADGSVR